ncbi:DUF805 domain-containing protein [Campylobacter fetus]|uniref:DUF805 domain-containing protein n=1 Tax=Campylobacter fetus TaxID=196 RepID=UPI000CFDE590|nr:DUF805 domain-containing protein [Campylobacter fetus]AVK80580.1 DUF805 domain-containing protein [Campylobacter fetus subsp. testudinum]
MLEIYRGYWMNFFEFNGVSSRKEFWIPVLINAILLIFLFAIPIIGFLAIAVNLIGSIAISIRRLRDAGFNPWWFIISLLPFLGLFLIVMFCYPTK